MSSLNDTAEARNIILVLDVVDVCGISLWRERVVMKAELTQTGPFEVSCRPSEPARTERAEWWRVALYHAVGRPVRWCRRQLRHDDADDE
jgi:hypothetical protein